MTLKGVWGKLKDKRVIGVIIAVLVAAMASMVLFYSMITDRVVDNAVLRMDEIAKHDKQTIYNSLTHKWNTLDGTAKVLRQKKFQKIEDLLVEINTQKMGYDCLELLLVADDGYVYSSNYSISRDDALFELCETSGEHFARRRDNMTGMADTWKEILSVGVKIKPFTVEGKNFKYIVSRMDIDVIQSDLAIDCYDGQGFSSVVDYDGNYIISRNRSESMQVRDNFYNDLSGVKIKGQYTVEDIHRKFADENDRDMFFIEYTNNTGERIMLFSHLEDTKWYFVINVSRSVFEKQSTEIVRIISAIFLIMLAVLTVLIMMFVKSRSQRENIELEKKYNRDLSAALERAEQANRAKTTFLNNMSHDIRTPMNAIIGFTALASTHLDNREQLKDYLGKISQSSNHLLSLINDVLDMSRIESGKIHLEEKPENLAEILHGLRDIVQTDMRAKQLELFIDTVDITNEDIYCDKLRLNQVMLNLLSNAMKFTPAGGTVSVRIAQLPSEKEGCARYEFRVKDTGIGMSREFAEHIFEPFTREQTSTVSGIQGTGLGMSIAKNIVDMQGGTITVESERGKGTEFIVSLDFRLQNKSSEMKTIKSLEGKRALVVDDGIDNCRSVSKMLRSSGMRAEWTTHGKEAVVRSQDAVEAGDPYDLYVIDWMMPGINGIETTRRIRRAVGNKVPVIILTVYDWADIEDDAREAGVTDFISKPLFMSDLRNMLLRVFGEKTAPQEEEKDSCEKRFKGRRILLTEDNELNREIAVTILGEAGFIMEEAENGQIAVEKVKDSEPGYYDLILMDIQMPIMDGYSAAKAIRALDNKELANIPIIAMTANAFEEDKRAAYDAGMNAHLGKPIDIPRLMEKLKEILE